MNPIPSLAPSPRRRLLPAAAFLLLASGAPTAQEDDPAPLSGVVLFQPRPNPPSEGSTILGGTPVLVASPSGTAAQCEPSAAVDPSDCFHLVASWNDYAQGDSRAGIGVSGDGGGSWFTGLVIEPSHQVQGNTAVASDRFGNLFLVMLSFNRDPTTGGAAAGVGSGIYMSVSTNGGGTWLPPVLIGPDAPNSFEDKPLLAVDTTAGPFDGTDHVVWTRFLDLNATPTTFEATQIRYARRVAGTAAFALPVVISDLGSNGTGACPAVGPGGAVYVAWKAGPNIYLDRSLNGGVTWGLDQLVFPISPLPPTLNPSVRALSFPTLVVDRSGGPLNGRLYIVWADYATGDADVLCRASTNGGLTWSAAVRVNDDPVANGLDQFLPWAAVGPDGTLHVTFLDRRDDPSNLLFRPSYARSIDGGATFSANLPLAPGLSSPYPNFGGTYLGDYSGIAADGNVAFPFWVDTAGGNQDVYTTGVHAGVGNLFASPTTISASAGADINFCLSAGALHEGRLYALLATASGTSPGVLLNGVVVPINPDVFTLVALGNPNLPPFSSFVGTLNDFGDGSAHLTVPPGAASPLVGQSLSFAFVLVNPLDFVSEVVSVTIGA